MFAAKLQATTRKLAIACFVLATAWGAAGEAVAKGPASEAAERTVSTAELPKQARETYALIGKGGPFPYDKDGVVFGNRERLLPAQKRGFYREYTVKTPGSRDRGARRIVCGGLKVTAPETCYYTDDHYASFRVIAP
jgi:ribonuclease T1